VEDFKGKECYAALKAFVKDNLETSNTYIQIMILCTQIQDHSKIFSHAGTFLRQESATGFVTIKYYDPNENHFFERGDHKIDFKKLFKRFETISVYALHGRLAEDPDEEERINYKMTCIMTEKPYRSFVAKKQIINAKASNDKRKRKGWRQGKNKK
jgi:hypothetical protein